MLVITRKPGQSFDIGDNVTVTILEMRPGQVSIGIDAPKDVSIKRDNMKQTKSGKS